MKKSIAKKWAKALMRATHGQATGQLIDGEKRCVLGVLCDVYTRETGHGAWDEKGRAFVAGGVAVSAWLPPAVSAWSGMHSDDGTIGRSTLTQKNDSGWGFKRLAKYILEKADKL